MTDVGCTFLHGEEIAALVHPMLKRNLPANLQNSIPCDLVGDMIAIEEVSRSEGEESLARWEKSEFD